jgi:hypothetical protein
MSAGVREYRTVAFGDADSGVWLTARAPAERGPGTASVVGRTAVPEHLDAEISAPDPEGDWTLSAEGVELELVPTGDAVELELGNTGLVAIDQPCLVRGAVSFDRAAREFEVLGRRGRRSPPDWSRLGSVRELAAWVAPSASMLVLAARPRKTRGHEDDALAAFLFDDGVATRVNDPRLSTTYDRRELPIKAGVELWVGEEENEYPRRGAGEAAAVATVREDEGARRTLIPFRWRMAGGEGAGVYDLAEPPANASRV